VRRRALAICRSLGGLIAVAALCAPLASAASGPRSTGWVAVKPQPQRAPSRATGRRLEARRFARESPHQGQKAQARFAGSGFAVGGGFQNGSDADRTRDLDLMSTAGAAWIRMDLNWSMIQAQGPSSYDWAPFDRVVTAATGRGFHILATLLYTPVWARPANGTASSPPVRLADYVAFARQAAQRYAPLGVHAYEIWNEPNITAFWQPRPDVAAYTAMLRGASAAIRSVDPQALIVTGGTSPAPDSGGNISPVSFLRGIYANGGKSAFDAVAHHPYCWPALPGDTQAWSAWYQMYGTSPSLRSVMADNGDAGKQIWATEFGAPTNGPAGSFVSEQTQATTVTRAFKLFRSYQWAGPLFWYSERDIGTSTSTRENFFGVLRNDFSPKPAFDAYKAATVG
jgi:polysaccharide biosynthesis protein PslG